MEVLRGEFRVRNFVNDKDDDEWNRRSRVNVLKDVRKDVVMKSKLLFLKI